MSQQPPVSQQQQGQFEGPLQQGMGGGQQMSGQQMGGQQMSGQQMGGQQTGDQSYVFGTQTYISEEARARLVQDLNMVLADTVVLESQVRYAHWNVKGMDFYGLHEMFEDIAETLEDHADEIAERISALGGQALGTAGRAVSNTRIPYLSSDLVVGQDFIRTLADHFAIHDANLYEAIQIANQYGDPDTADLLNDVSRVVTKNLWFLEAHLQSQPVSTVQVTGGQQGQMSGMQAQQPQPQQFQTQQPPAQQFQTQAPQTQQPTQAAGMGAQQPPAQQPMTGQGQPPTGQTQQGQPPTGQTQQPPTQ